MKPDDSGEYVVDGCAWGGKETVGESPKEVVV